MRSLKYHLFLALRSKSFWLVLIGMLLFSGVTTVFYIVDESNFFKQIQSENEGFFINAVISPLSDFIPRIVPLIAVFLIIIIVLLLTNKYANRTIIYPLTYSNSRTKQFFSEVLVVVMLSAIISAISLCVMAASYFMASAVYEQTVPPISVLTVESVAQIFLYMLFVSLFVFALSELIRNTVASAVVGILWSVGLIEVFFGWSVFGRAVMYYPFNLLSELLGNSVYHLSGGSTPVYMSMGEAVLWLSIYAVVFLTLAWFSYAKRDALN